MLSVNTAFDANYKRDITVTLRESRCGWETLWVQRRNVREPLSLKTSCRAQHYIKYSCLYLAFAVSSELKT